MKKLLISILAVLTLAGTAKAETVFTINNIGGWYIVGVTAYKVGDHRPNEAFEKFAVNLGQKRVFSSKDWKRVDVRKDPNTPNTCLLYTSPSPRDS